MEVFQECVNSNKQELQNKKTFLMAAYFGSRTFLLFQLLLLLLLFLFWGEVLFCFYLEWDKGAYLSGKLWKSISYDDDHILFHISKQKVICVCWTLCELCKLFDNAVRNLRVVHSEQLLWLLADGQAGLPQVLVHVQLQQDLPDVSVPVPHTVQLLHLLSVHSLKVGVESCLDAINHILHLELSEIRQRTKQFLWSWWQ